MQKILSALIITICATGSVFADDSLNCDATDIGATTPKTRLRATWTPNTYNIGWYDEDGTQLNVQNAAQTCSYGSDLVIPDSAPTKIGYTFIGWEVAEPNPLADLDTSMSPISAGMSNFVEGNELGSANVEEYGLTGTGVGALTFPYGVVYMAASCNSTKPSNYDNVAAQVISIREQRLNHTITKEEANRRWGALYGDICQGQGNQMPANTFTNSVTGGYCWCCVNGYTPDGGEKQTINNLPWVATLMAPDSELYETQEECAEYCVYFCLVSGAIDNRHYQALYGQN